MFRYFVGVLTFCICFFVWIDYFNFCNLVNFFFFNWVLEIFFIFIFYNAIFGGDDANLCICLFVLL